MTRFQSYLLAIVYGHGERGVSRAKVADLLWESDLDKAARHRISQLLYGLKKRAGEEVVRLERNRLIPYAGRIDCPYLTLQDNRSLEWVVEDHFLSRLDPPYPSRGLEDWVSSMSLTADRSASRSNEVLIRQLASEGRLERTRSSALRASKLDPENPFLSEAHATALAGQGEVEEAARFLRSEIARFEAGGSCEAGDELRRVLSNIQYLAESNELTAGAWELFGRTKDVGNVLAAGAIGSSHARVIVVAGDAGIGKTHFLHTLARREAIEGYSVVSHTCREGESTIPFNTLGELIEQRPFVDSLSSLVSPWREIVLDSFPSVLMNEEATYTAPAVRPPRTTERRLLEAVSRLFRSALTERPLSIHIDDFHWIDRGSCTALRFIQRKLAGVELNIVLSLRPDEIQSDNTPDCVRLFTRMASSWVELDILDRVDTRQLIEAVSPGLSPKLVERAEQISGGVPLFAVELAKEYEERSERGLTIDESGTIASVRSLYESRLRRLTENAHRLLQLCAILDSPISQEPLAQLAELNDLAFLSAAHQLERFRLVEISGGRIDIRHALVRKTLYLTLSRLEREALHRRAVRYFEMTEDSDGLYRIAKHALQGGMLERSYEAALTGAGEALGRGDVGQAIEMLHIGRDAAGTAVERARALRMLGHLVGLQGEYSEAAKILEEAAQLTHQGGDRSLGYLTELKALHAKIEAGRIAVTDAQERIQGVKRECRIAGWTLGVVRALDLEIRLADYAFDVPRACESLREIDALGDATEDQRIFCLVQLIRTRHLCYGSPTVALDAAREALEIARRHSLDEELGLALKRYLVVFMYQGLLDTSEARAVVRLAREAHLRTGDLQSLFDVLVNLGVWHLDIGNPGVADDYFSQASNVVDAFPRSPERAVLDLNQAESRFWQGDYASARDRFAQAYAALPDSRRKAGWCGLAGLALCDLALGRIGNARELDQEIPASHQLMRAPTFDPSLIAILRARLAEVRGKPIEGAELLEEWGDRLRGRIVPASLKIMLAEIRLRRKHKLSGTRRRALAGKEVAEKLAISSRVREFERLL